MEQEKRIRKKNTRGGQTRTCITCRALRRRRRLFGIKWRSKECEGAERRHRLSEKYENFLKGANKKILNVVGKQGELLKCFRDGDEFFDRIGLGRSNIYFKISLYKFLRKFTLLKNSTLTYYILKLILN